MPRIVGTVALVIALTFVMAVLCYVGWALLPTVNPLARLAQVPLERVLIGALIGLALGLLFAALARR